MKSSEKEMMKFKEITLSPGNSPLIILPSPILTDNEHKQQNQGIQSSIISKNGITKELSGHDAESPGIKIVENDLKIDEENNEKNNGDDNGECISQGTVVHQDFENNRVSLITLHLNL